jgi:hypothetical protein
MHHICSVGGSNLQKNNVIYFLFCICFQYQHLHWRYLACTLYFLVVTYFPVFIYWSDLVLQKAYKAQFIVKKRNQPVLVLYTGFQRYVPREVCRTGMKLYHIIKNWGHILVCCFPPLMLWLHLFIPRFSSWESLIHSYIRVIHKVTLSSPYLWASFTPYPLF